MSAPGPGSAPPQTRRAHLKTVAGLAGTGMLVACGAPGAKEASKSALSEAPVTVQFVTRSGKTEEDFNSIFGDWYAKHPNWKIQVTRGVNPEKLSAFVAADEKMDTLGWFQAARTVILLMNILRPIDDYVKKDKYPVQQFSAKEVDLIGRYDGKLYSLPYAYGGNATAMFFNRSLFRDAGVPEPPTDWSKTWTWDQFRENLRKLTKKSGTAITQVGLTGIGDPITSLCVLSDAQWISDDYKKAKADAPATMETFQRYADLVLKDGVVQSSLGADLGSGNAFLNGKAALHTVCCGPLSFSKKVDDAGIDWGFMPMPKMKYSSLDFQSVVLMQPKSGQNPEHGWELFKYFIEDSRFGNLEQRMPAVLADAPTWAKETYGDRPQVRGQVLADGVKIARPVDKIKYHPNSAAMYEAVNPALKDIWAGKVPVKQTFATLQTQLQTIIDSTPGGK